MRLLNVYTNKLEEFFSPVIPKYAILSHRWGSKEVTFQDLNAFDSQDWESTAVKRAGPGLMKIVYTCLQAKKEDLGYIWVDTCCIDKSSSAELSEAINSMYTYYQGSDVCYAYLDDVRDLDHSGADQADFTSSKWFTRGWTLQELLAPSKLRFFGINWKFLGDRTNLSRLVSLRTSIPEEIVKDPSYVRSTSIANRMSWAADRQTTRVEDVAYSLLGIFNVNMPLLYGEGEKAFIRLQEEIIRGSDDQSIFAWEWNKEEAGYAWFSGPLANSPARFRKSGNIIPLPSNAARQPYTMTNKGLRIETDLTAGTPPVAILECHYDNDFSGLLGIRLRDTGIPSVYMRAPGELVSSRPSRPQVAELRTIYIVKNHPLTASWPSYKTCRVDSDSMSTYGFDIVEVAPRQFPFNWKGQTLKMLLGDGRKMVAFKFRNSRWDHEPIVLFTITSSGNKGFLKIVGTQGEEPLQQLLEKEPNTTEFFTRQSMPLPPPRNSTNQNTTFIINAIVKKEIIFRQDVFVLTVGITTGRI